MRVGAYDEDRYDRMRRIDWLDVDALAGTRCLIVGAGALGNEAVKCMALAGFGELTIVDTDAVDISNLSRCVLFGDDDDGASKAEVLAARAEELNPDVRATAVVARVQELEDWGYGIVIGCLDNVAARLHVNAHAVHHSVPYVDGATDGFRGKVQAVLPGGPCLECAMNRSHMELMDTRFSCTGGGTIFRPRMAAEITTTSVVAAVQVREAMKIASGRSDLCMRNVMYYDGVTGASDIYGLSVDPGCPNHERSGSE